MKINFFKFNAALAGVLAMIVAQNVSAKDSPQLAEVEQVLAGAAAPELPVNAASLVSQSQDSEKESVTMLVVRTVSEINPTSLPAVVGAIGRATPGIVSVAAANAVSMRPKQVVLITRAAVSAAPGHAGEIVSAILEKLPAQYALVAAAAADVAPAAGKDILNAVIAAVPSLKPYIEKSISTVAVSAGNVPVLTILNQSAILARRDQSASQPVAFAATATPTTATVVPSATVASSATSSESAATPVETSTAVKSSVRLIAIPVFGPPPVPLTTTPIEIDPGQTGPQTPGGRNYSSP